MDERSQRLRDALVAGFEPYVRSGVDFPAAEGEGLEEAIESGRSMLERDLEALFAMDAARQAATPVQVFRAALVPVREWLSRQGPAAANHPGEPDDSTDFGPASAAAISPEALEASLAWGVGKAAELRRPLAVQVGSNLMDASRFEAATESSGYRFERWADPSPEDVPVVAFVDLEGDGADDAIRVLAERGTKVVAYGPHVDDLALVRARSLGAEAAEPRSRVLRGPAAFLPPLV